MVLGRAFEWVLGRTARPQRSDDPTIPLSPRGLQPPLLFLHIPKTGGSSLGAALTRLYGRRNRILHVEHWLAGFQEGRNPASRVDCVTTHLLWREWQGVPGHAAYPAATILRDPWARLVSHVNYNARFLTGKPMPQGGPVAEALARATQALSRTDFSEPNSIARFVAAVRAERHLRHYDNLQLNMLTPWAPDRDTPQLGAAGIEAAMGVLRQMAVVGFADRSEDFLRRLAARVQRPVPPVAHRNVTRDRVLTTDNSVAREIMLPLFERDQALFDAARAEFAGR